ncbi:putative oxidoreductase [Janthinobacterium sp. OK676]|uniref:DoxX family protein n=1 Tax=unclassified Janthinobacterium TaxID=2610881 RepID=UPI00088B1F91|nr:MULTISPECIES: DoxX family protein [unclassified Janthinobacterium]PJJ18750.1 putative oxidoreductase [Janthinobacterium sp. 67]SDL77188.1 putative oxidoreductase [Janthinobacterium sp. OK676]
MENRSNVLLPLGRAALGVLFFVSGLLKIGGFAGVAGYMASQGLPIANILLVGVIALEVGGGLLLITGWQARWAALALALFLIPTTLIFHAFWSADAAHFQDQLTNFLKNLSIFGGMLLLVERGFGKASRLVKA